MQASRDFSSNEGEILHFIAIRLDGNLRTIENITNVDSSPAFYLLFVFSNNPCVVCNTASEEEDSKMSLCDQIDSYKLFMHFT